MGEDMKQNGTAFFGMGLAAGLTAFLAAGLVPFFVMQRAYMTAQQNLIGILYEQDAKICAEIVPLFFEREMYFVKTEEGEAAMHALGYTRQGISYLFQNAGLGRMLFAALLPQIFLAGLLLLFLYGRDRKRRQEEARLAAWVRRAKAKGECEQNVSYRFFGRELIFEITDVLQRLYANRKFWEEKNRSMQRFMENIAHQMKTPLSCISLSLDFMAEQQSSGWEERLSECFSCVERMHTLLHMLLRIGRLENGTVVMQKERIDIELLLKECQGALPEGERIELDAKGMGEQIYYGDSDWLREAFLNLFKNCLEHDTGGQSIQVSASASSEAVTIRIRDHGAGILQEDLPYIFDRFYVPEQVKKSHTGLGLNLARLIIERHFGSLKAGNHPEGGAVFTVALPIYSLKNEKIQTNVTFL